MTSKAAVLRDGERAKERWEKEMGYDSHYCPFSARSGKGVYIYEYMAV